MDDKILEQLYSIKGMVDKLIEENARLTKENVLLQQVLSMAMDHIQKQTIETMEGEKDLLAAINHKFDAHQKEKDAK